MRRSLREFLSQDRQRPTRGYRGDKRSAFERDYDRIIYSSSFRRLKDKAQVFPLEQNDFIRSRLTHSLETSTIGRSLGVEAVGRLDPDDKKLARDVADILAAGCLIHDVGNPPFGHFGESVIQKWFEGWFEKRPDLVLSPSAKLDFLHFDGNAQGFRIVTKLQMLDDEYGLNLTYSTLASTIKYPCSANDIWGADHGTESTLYKKPGYYQSEKAVFDLVDKHTGMQGNRHPLSFLLEAADDIAYTAADIEDGFRNKILSLQDLLDALHDVDPDIEKDVVKHYREAKYQGLPRPEDVAVQKFRILVQGQMIRAVGEAFYRWFPQISEGELRRSLLSVSDAKLLSTGLKRLAQERVFNASDVLERELAGSRVLTDLLEAFVPAVVNNDSRSNQRLWKLISPNFRYFVEKYEDNSLEARLHLAVDHISGMTDSYALRMYRRLAGVELP